MDKGKREGGATAISLTDAAATTDSFRIWEFKVKRCPRSRPHDWTQCPFAHPSEKAKRRDPRRYKYSGTACPDFRKNGTCRRGDACEFAHGVFECWLHPARYRTQVCTDGLACKRRVCFFAHHEGELRKVQEEGAPSAGKDVDVLAEAQAYQQQLAALAATLPAGRDLSGHGGGEPPRGAAPRARPEPAGDAGLGEHARALQAQALAQALAQAHAGSAGSGQGYGAGGDPAALAGAAAALLGGDGAALLRLVAASQAQVQCAAEAELAARASADAAAARRSLDGRRSLDSGPPGVGRGASLDLQWRPRASLDSRAPYGACDYARERGAAYSQPPAPSSMGYGWAPGGGAGDLLATGHAEAARVTARALSQRRFSVDGLLEARRGGGGGGHRQCALDQAYAAALAPGLPAAGPAYARMGDLQPHAPQHAHAYRRSVDLGALSRAGLTGHGAFGHVGGGGLEAGCARPCADAAMPMHGRASGSHSSSASSESCESLPAPAGTNPNTIFEGAQWLCSDAAPLGARAPPAPAADDARAALGAFPMAAGRAPVREFLVRNASFDSIVADLPRSVSELNLMEAVGASSALVVNGAYDQR